MFTSVHRLNWLPLAIVVACSVSLPDGIFAQEDTVDFKKTIKPLFEKYCISCHGPDEVQVFRIDDKEDAMDFIEPGNAEESILYEVLVTDDEYQLMPPPDEENPMSAEEIKLVKLWIDQGAEWPEDDESDELTEGATEKDTAEQGASVPPVDLKDGDEAVPALVTEPSEDAEPAKPADAASIDPRIFRAIGSLHPAILHLPMGLLLGAGFFALLSLRGNFVMSDCAYYCLWLGMLGCILASITGWYFSPVKRMGAVEALADLWNTDHRVFWHRTGGLIVTVLAIFVALYASNSRNKNPDDGLIWKLMTILLAGFIGWVGHEGGKLTYGKHHYKDLNELAGEWLPGLFGAKDDEGTKPKPPAANETAPPAPKMIDAAETTSAAEPFQDQRDPSDEEGET